MPTRGRIAAAVHAATLALALLGWLLVTPDGRASERRIEVTADQTTTVVGTFDSVVALLSELCAQADAELRGFAAPDRRITVDQVGKPLGEVLERILERESYLLGVRETPSSNGAPAIAWIQVTGARTSEAAALPGLTVPSRFGTQAFEEEGTDATAHARQAVAERLLTDEQRVAQLLTVDAEELARSLRQYPHIEDLLRGLRAGRDPAVAAKLDAVIDALSAMDGSRAD